MGWATSTRFPLPRRDAGFTLLELLVVLGIMALAFGISMPSLLSSRDQVRLRPLAAQLSTDLKRARVVAMSGGAAVSFLIEPATHSYRIEGVSRSVALPRTAAVTWTTPRETLKVNSVGRIVFFPDGSATGGRLILADAKGERLVLMIDGITGTVANVDALP
jgi:general secretion pathway protein H